MQIRSPRDFWSGLIFIAIALGFIVGARRYGMGDMHLMGPGLFATLVGALLAALGAVVVLRSLAIDGPPVPHFYLRPIAISVVAITLFGMTLQYFGLIAAVAVVVLIGALASRESRPIEVAGLVVLLAVFSVAVFVWMLGLPIPLWPDA
jgi:putative tricarboxylic transport membrane protein